VLTDWPHVLARIEHQVKADFPPESGG